MRVKLMVAAVLISSLLAAEARAEELGLGLRPMTLDEERWLQETGTRIGEWLPNETALERVNSERAAAGFGPLTLEELSALWSGEVPVGDPENVFAPAPPLPSHVDNSATQFFPPIRSQGPIGSCASWAATYYQFTYYNARAHGWNAASGNNASIFSPRFVYNMINGGSDSGSNVSGNYNMLVKHGSARWSDWPYANDYLPWCRSAATWKDAMRFRIDRHGSITDLQSTEGLENLKRALANGHVMYLSTYFTSFRYNTVDDASGSDVYAGQHIVFELNGTAGGHAMTLVGYDDDIWYDFNNNSVVDPGEVGAFKVANSHGTSYRNSGYVWFAYDALYSSTRVSGWTQGSNRRPIFTAANWMEVKKDYKPKMIAEFTLSTYQRRFVSIAAGVGEPGDEAYRFYEAPAAFNWSGGNYCFNGTTTLCSGSFAFDLTPAMSLAGDPARYSRYFLKTQMYGGYDLDVTAISIIDNVNSATIPVSGLPGVIPSPGVNYYYVDYGYSTANTPPTISVISDQLIGVNESTGPIAFTISDAETDASGLGLEVTSSNSALLTPACVVYGGAGSSRTVELIPLAGKTGSATVTIRVTDGELSALAAFQLNVASGGNTPPTISEMPDLAVTAGQTVEAGFTVGDAQTPAEELAVAITFENAGSILSASVSGIGAARTARITPRSDAPAGTIRVSIEVSDGSLISVETFVLTVDAASSNTAPMIAPISNQQVNQGHVVSVSVFVNDAETEPSALAVSAEPSSWLVDYVLLEGEGAWRTLHVIPRSSEIGPVDIEVRVSDGELETSTVFAVDFLPTGNTPPVIGQLADITMPRNGAVDVPFTICDSEMESRFLWVQTSSYNTSLVSPWNGGMEILGEGISRTLRITPVADAVGSVDLQIRADDFSSSWTEMTFNVNIVDNASPTVSSIADQSVPMNGTTGPIAFVVGDAETPASSLTASAATSDYLLLPPSAVVLGGSGANRTIAVTPAAGRSGTATVTVTVGDGELTAAEPFTVTVTSANSAPAISAVEDQIVELNGTAGPLAFTVVDAEAAAAGLVVSAVSSDPALIGPDGIALAGSGSNRTVTLTPETDMAGVAVLTLFVDDGEASSATSFTLIVKAVDVPPAISHIDDQTAFAGGQLGPLPITLTDPDTQLWNYTLKGYSSDQSLVLDRDILISGHSGNYNLSSALKAGISGVCVITVRIENWSGVVFGSETFTLTINPDNAPIFDVLGYSAMTGSPHQYKASFSQGDPIPASAVGISASDLDVADTLTMTIVEDSSGYTGSVKPAFASPVVGSGAVSMELSCGSLDGSGKIVYAITVSDGKASDVFATVTILVNASGNTSPAFSAGAYSRVTGGPVHFTAVFERMEVVSPSALGIGGTDADSSDALTLTAVRDNQASTYTGSTRPAFTSPKSGASPVAIPMSTVFPLNGLGRDVYKLTLTDGEIAEPIDGTLTVIVNGPPVIGADGFDATSCSGANLAAELSQGQTVGAGLLGVFASDPNTGDTVTLTVTQTGGTYSGSVWPAFASPASAPDAAIVELTTASPLDGTGTITYEITASDGVSPGPATGTLTVTVTTNSTPVLNSDGFTAVSGGPTAFAATLCRNQTVSPGLLGITGTDADAGNVLVLTAVRTGGTYAGAVEPQLISPASGYGGAAIEITTDAPLNGTGSIVYTLSLSDGVAAPVNGTLTVQVLPNSAPVFDGGIAQGVAGGPLHFTASVWKGYALPAWSIGIGGVDPDGFETIALTAVRSGGTYSGTVAPAFASPMITATPAAIWFVSGEAFDGTGSLVYHLALDDGFNPAVAGTLTIDVNDKLALEAGGFSGVSGGPTSFTSVLSQGSVVSAGILGIRGVDSAGDSVTLTAVRTGGTYAGTVEPQFASPAVGTGSASVSMTTSSPLDGEGTIIYAVSLTDGAIASPVTGVLTLTVTALPIYTITSSAGANGSISPYGAVQVIEGNDRSFTITPDAGYHVDDVLVDSVSVGAVSSYEFTNVTGSHTIAASFAINSYTITASAGTGGAISPSGAVAVDHGQSRQFTIMADAGYHVDDVLVDSVSVGAVASYEFTNVTGSHTIIASFAANPQEKSSGCAATGGAGSGWAITSMLALSLLVLGRRRNHLFNFSS